MPTTDKHHIEAYADDSETLHCMKCERTLETHDVAMFIRSAPTDAFTAWCPGCTLRLVEWAFSGMQLQDIAETIMVF